MAVSQIRINDCAAIVSGFQLDLWAYNCPRENYMGIPPKRYFNDPLNWGPIGGLKSIGIGGIKFSWKVVGARGGYGFCKKCPKRSDEMANLFCRTFWPPPPGGVPFLWGSWKRFLWSSINFQFRSKFWSNFQFQLESNLGVKKRF